MLRMRAITDAKAAGSYYGATDGGIDYYLASKEMRREVGGKAAEMLGITTPTNFDKSYDHFSNLLNGLHPVTGEKLTSKLVPGRLAGWDVTGSIPKGVTLALEGGDSRIHDALWEAGRETMADLESMITTRQRKGGVHENRVTGNMVYFAFEHPETRPAKQDRMPDPDRHIHFVIPNVTYDEVEGEWKAIKFRPIMDDRKWFDRRFDMRLASKLADLGYNIDTTYKQGKYYSWDIKGIPETLKAKHSRRSQEVEKLAKELKVETAVGKDKLGATSRLHKREDMTLEDYRAYWNGKASENERKGLAEAIKGALRGLNPKQTNTAEKGLSFAIGHEFYRNSVIDQKKLEITAMERCMGGAKPEEMIPEALRQGVLLKNGEATTREVLAEEGRIIDFAREGKGTMRPLGCEDGLLPRTLARNSYPPKPNSRLATPAQPGNTATLSPEQQGKTIGIEKVQNRNELNLSAEQRSVVEHIHNSTDRVIMIEGDAGTGKTQTMQRTIPGIDKPGVFLAPSASASRGTLREKGFENADTIARFLVDPKLREGARNGYIYIDEAPLAGISDIDKVFRHAKELNARLILQGDRKQHTSVARGNLFEILDKFAGLPIGRLTENWRQKHKGYKEAVAEIAKGSILKGHDILDKLGWVKYVDGNSYSDLVADYLRLLDDKKSVLVVAPTHRPGDAITARIREQLKEQGKLKDERVFERLVPLHLTPTQKTDRHSYDGTEVLQFTRNSGAYKAGDRVSVGDLKNEVGTLRPEHFTPFTPSTIRLSIGDAIRTTNGGVATDKSGGKHRLDNGSEYRIDGFTPKGDIKLDNGWIVAKDFKHLNHAYVGTSYAAQGKTVDVVLGAMGSDSLGAMNAAQFYVTASRARQRVSIYTDLPAEELRKQIQKSEPKKSASELMNRPVFNRYAELLKRHRRRVYESLRERQGNDKEHSQERRYGHSR